MPHPFPDQPVWDVAVYPHPTRRPHPDRAVPGECRRSGQRRHHCPARPNHHRRGCNPLRHRPHHRPGRARAPDRNWSVRRELRSDLDARLSLDLSRECADRRRGGGRGPTPPRPAAGSRVDACSLRRGRPRDGRGVRAPLRAVARGAPRRRSARTGPRPSAGAAGGTTSTSTGRWPTRSSASSSGCCRGRSSSSTSTAPRS